MPVYSAESSAKNLRSAFRSMWSGMRNSRYIAYRIFVKDLRTEWAQSVCGIVWDFVDPLVLAIIFWTLYRASVFRVGEVNMPYALFVIYGFLIYQTFFDAVTLPIFVQERSRSIMAHVKIPPEALLISVFFRVLFNHGIRIAILLIITLFLTPPNWPFLSKANAANAPPSAAKNVQTQEIFSTPEGRNPAKARTAASSAPAQQAENKPSTPAKPAFTIIGFCKFILFSPLLIFGGMSIGILLAPFHNIYRDVGKMARIILNPLRYLTPVMYPIPKSHLFKIILTFNPVAAILESLRSVAVSNHWADVPGTLGWAGVYVALFFVGWFIFHLSIPILSDRV